jgi:periplasmic divalent cation tolerance protein
LGECYAQVETAILAAHSYDLPEIIQLPIERGYPPFLEWIKEKTNKKNSTGL